MRRFFLSSPPRPDGTLVLEGAEAAHAAKVIRLKSGDYATVLDGRGGEFVCEVQDIDRKRVICAIQDQKKDPKPATELKLIQSVVKGKAFDLVLQKAIELGATEIVPVISSRAVAKIPEREFADKFEKWNQVAIEAIKQCGATWLPEICEPKTLSEAIERDQATELRMVGSLRLNATHPSAQFEQFRETKGRSPRSVSGWIGPEGDFTEEEYQLLEDSGVTPVSFGDRVLRSETAAFYALSIANYEIGSHR